MALGVAEANSKLINDFQELPFLPGAMEGLHDLDVLRTKVKILLVSMPSGRNITCHYEHGVERHGLMRVASVFEDVIGDLGPQQLQAQFVKRIDKYVNVSRDFLTH